MQYKLTAKLKQNGVIPQTECVDMNKTRFAWARVFPIVFQQEYIVRKLTLRHDITEFITVREKNVNENNRMECLIGRYGGVLIIYQLFALVLYNHKNRSQIDELESLYLNTEDINRYTIVDYFKNMVK